MSNSWQTVADHVKTTEFTVKDLRPNTVYLFIIRAVNAQGLGDPSPMSDPVRTQGTTDRLDWTVSVDFFFPSSCLYLFPPLDISPTAQGVDHRRVQKELGDVVVNMHNPVVLSSTSVQVTWTVSRPQTDRISELCTQRASSPEQLVLHQFWVIWADGKSRVMFLFGTNESPLGDTCVTPGGSL